MSTHVVIKMLVQFSSQKSQIVGSRPQMAVTKRYGSRLSKKQTKKGDWTIHPSVSIDDLSFFVLEDGTLTSCTTKPIKL